MRLNGKVAYITGAARGQGRNHAVRMAAEGADLVLSDICAPVAESMIRPSTPEDLADTLAAIRNVRSDTRVIARPADVRDPQALADLADEAVGELGKIDVVVANAGILNYAEFEDYTLEMFQACIDVCLTGVFNTCKATIPHMIRAGNGGSVILVSSTAGLKGQPFTPGYTSAKHALVGLGNGLANELGGHRIRVNTLHPAGVTTPMGEAMGFMEIIGRHAHTIGPVFMNTLPVEMMSPDETSNAVIYLASDESSCVTGLQMKVDAGNCNR